MCNLRNIEEVKLAITKELPVEMHEKVYKSVQEWYELCIHYEGHQL
jgi:hypothetical protein